MEETSFKFTSFFGGKESNSQPGTEQQFLSGAGAYCSLLEIGETRLLLDCGCLSSFDEGKIDQLRQEILTALNGRQIDAILITHADLAHVGALPYLCGKNGPFPDTPVICTLPVLKMSHMVLYDHYLRLKSEGTRLKSKRISTDTPGSRAVSMLQNSTGLDLTLDDIDDSLEHARMVKFGQRAEIVLTHDDEGSGRSAQSSFLTLCAHPSGRTVGGTSWVIRQGTTEVLYVVDINLRKELSVDGAAIARLPTSPSVMIVESGHDTSSSGTTGKKEKKEEGSLLSSLLSGVMDTVRLEGSVLIPIETVSRTLELIYILGKFWEEKKLGGMYHLVYLSPMAHNVIEYAKSQLEWMPDSLSRDFYLGRANPFSLAHLHTCSSVAEVMALGTGPKVVLATDASLSSGLSKELLLRWGGNPSCRVIFTDRSEPASLSAQIREHIAASEKQNAQKGPIIVSVNSTQRVLLSGDDLDTYWQLKEEEVRRLEELEHRHLREKELATLIGGGPNASGKEEQGGLHLGLKGGEEEDLDDAATSDESDGSDFDDEDDEEDDVYVPEDAATDDKAKLKKKRKQRDHLRKKKNAKKTKSIGRIAQYATPRFQMFETRELRHLPEYMDEYGLDNDDLTITDIVTSTSLVPKQGKIHRTKELASGRNSSGSSNTQGDMSKRVTEEAHVEEEDVIDPTAPPSKVISTPTRVQLTCAFKEIAPSAWGRLDFKGVKTLINKCSPKHLIVLHGGNNVTNSSPSRHARGMGHMKKVLDYATKSMGAARVFAPEVNQPVSLQIPTDLFRVIVSDHNLIKGSSLPSNGRKAVGMQMLAIPPSSSSTGASSACSVGTFVGTLAALTQYDRSIFSDMSLHDGILTTKWVEKQQLEDGGGGEDQAESRTQTQTEIEIEKEAVEEEVREEADLVDDWARQYQESLSRSKQGQQEGSEEVEAGAGVDETVPAEDNNEDEYYEDTYDDYDHDEILIDEEGIDELHTPEYTGNSDLYATSFLSGGLGPPDSLLANGLRVGSVSAGEVQLQTLQQELEAEGVAVEYKLGLAGAGAMLLCGGQVIIRKTNENDFLLEGPPCTALNVAKRAVYKRFCFL